MHLLTEVVESQMPCDVHLVRAPPPVLPCRCHELYPSLRLMDLFKHMSYMRQDKVSGLLAYSWRN